MVILNVEKLEFYNILLDKGETMGRQVYQEGAFKVYRAGRNFIVHNGTYDFSEKHTHIRNLGTAKKLIRCVLRNVVPKTNSQYLLRSLTRLSDDEKYVAHVDSLIQTRMSKGPKQKYKNHGAKG